ncbi:MAG: hypothetical protein QS98_C0005G0093 [archaeon GW2011_AR3]|nr:MAG: hypothetical protein QS98_C0005G0093 [archaeon GW2011_AR3]MBS3109402.1 hypothetical protein [Candidatus Woesearchaeota archaeon]
MGANEKILDFVKQKGPVIPAEIARHLNVNNLFASALLAELVDRGGLHLTHVKVGGSPVYYLEGQEDRLQEFSKYLPEKEQRACKMLRESKVLSDAELEPLYRVALRQIKDYAKPFEVSIGEDKHIFWKWYMLPNSEAEEIIKKKIGMAEKESRGSVAGDEVAGEMIKAEKASIAGPGQKDLLGTISHTDTLAQAKKEKSEAQKKPKPLAAQKQPGHDFLRQIIAYFEEHKIAVVEQEIIKKNTEIDFILTLPSPVGSLTYYCKAKNKQRCSDLDLSAAYVKGEIKKLPVLFLTTGKYTKKAGEMLAKEFKNIKAHTLN